MPRLPFIKKHLSEIHPAIYDFRIKQKRIFRNASDVLRKVKFANKKSADELAFCVKKHQSLLRRKLGTSDPQLQTNKVQNLQLAAPLVDELLIRPGETFSFWNSVGETTVARGYLEGMQLSKGLVVCGIGGGLCQLANLLYWMALHTQLTVSERHHHSFDPFPDENRTLPFGSGASVFFNYVDLRFFNNTKSTYQLRVWVSENHLCGKILVDREPVESFHIIEKKHRFLTKGQQNFRENEIWRRKVDKRTGNTLGEEMLIKNFAEVKYKLEDTETT
ncbi:MAG: VanW family protein [Pyrinomonadaceae bacterium]